MRGRTAETPRVRVGEPELRSLGVLSGIGLGLRRYALESIRE